MIDEGQAASRAELARRLGVSRARVTQMLRLLTLDPSVIDAIVQLG
jgi:ParB-like chromosome segregation protein Spo0J